MNPSTSNSSKRLLDLMLWASAVGALWSALNKGLGTAASIPFRYAHNYAEPVVANVLLNISNTPLLYRNFATEPFTLNPYNPPYYYLSYLLMPFTGSPLTAGRLASFIAGGLACFFIYRILRCLGVRRAVCLVFSALFIQIPLVQGQWASMRPDFMGLMFSLGALSFLLDYERRRMEGKAGAAATSGWSYGAGVLLAVLAILTKQNFVAAAGAYFLYVLSQRRLKDAVRFGALVALGVTVPTLIWNAATHGDYALNQLMNAKKSFYPALIPRFWKEYVTGHALLTAAAAAAFIMSPRQPLKRMVFLFLLLTAASTVTLGKIGSDQNYFLEFTAAACLCAGLFSEGLTSRLKLWPAQAAGGAAAVGLVLLFAGVSGGLALTRIGSSGSGPHPFDEITAIVQKIPGPVLAENMGILLAAGKPIVYEPYEFTQLTYTGLWDEQKILDKLDRREFPLILLETNLWKARKTSRFSPAFIEHFHRNYRPAKVIAGQILCVPKTDVKKSG